MCLVVVLICKLGRPSVSHTRNEWYISTHFLLLSLLFLKLLVLFMLVWQQYAHQPRTCAFYLIGQRRSALP